MLLAHIFTLEINGSPPIKPSGCLINGKAISPYTITLEAAFVFLFISSGIKSNSSLKESGLLLPGFLYT